MRKFVLFLGLLLIDLYSSSQASEINKGSKFNAIPVSRATPNQFLNGHVMSQKTYDSLRRSKPGMFAENFQNFLKNVDKKNPMSRKNGGHMPNDAYQTRQVHTFVVGNRKDVANSIVKGQLLPKTPQGHTIVESNKNFKLVEARRGKGHQLPTIHDLGERRFAAGVEKAQLGGKPVHYQAKYKGTLNGLQGNNPASKATSSFGISPGSGQKRHYNAASTLLKGLSGNTRNIGLLTSFNTQTFIPFFTTKRAHAPSSSTLPKVLSSRLSGNIGLPAAFNTQTYKLPFTAQAPTLARGFGGGLSVNTFKVNPLSTSFGSTSFGRKSAQSVSRLMGRGVNIFKG